MKDNSLIEGELQEIIDNTNDTLREMKRTNSKLSNLPIGVILGIMIGETVVLAYYLGSMSCNQKLIIKELKELNENFKELNNSNQITKNNGDEIIYDGEEVVYRYVNRNVEN